MAIFDYSKKKNKTKKNQGYIHTCINSIHNKISAEHFFMFLEPVWG